MFADLSDRFHAGDECVGGFIGEIGEARDGSEKMLGMGEFDVIDAGVEHVDDIGFVGVIGNEHVNVFA